MEQTVECFHQKSVGKHKPLFDCVTYKTDLMMMMTVPQYDTNKVTCLESAAENQTFRLLMSLIQKLDKL